MVPILFEVKVTYSDMHKSQGCYYMSHFKCIHSCNPNPYQKRDNFHHLGVFLSASFQSFPAPPTPYSFPRATEIN